MTCNASCTRGAIDSFVSVARACTAAATWEGLKTALVAAKLVDAARSDIAAAEIQISMNDDETSEYEFVGDD